ncbi:MAG: alanine racemase [Bdellovibrionota bacterium]
MKMRSSLNSNKPEINISAPRVVMDLNPASLLSNFRALRTQVGPGCGLLAMVKANAYGHGMEWCAAILAQEPGLAGFGVATLQEGISLRASVKEAKILVFSGASGFTDEIGRVCERYALTPVLADLDDWNRFLAGGWPARLPYHLKFNTGMNRLGIDLSDAPTVRRELAVRFRDHARSRPSGILTHLAASEDPTSALTRKQMEGFRHLRSEFGAVAPEAVFHFANSGAIWNSRALKVASLSGWVRPGLSLYGVVPWAQAPERGLRPVMTVRSRILQLRLLQAGQRVGYGGRFRVGQKPVGGTEVATLAFGYGDGLPQSGFFLTETGKRLPLVGRVSMDLAAVEVPRTLKLKVGDWLQYLGAGVPAWDQALRAGKIPYELFTALTVRVVRQEGSLC